MIQKSQELVSPNFLNLLLLLPLILSEKSFRIPKRSTEQSYSDS